MTPRTSAARYRWWVPRTRFSRRVVVCLVVPVFGPLFMLCAAIVAAICALRGLIDEVSEVWQ